MLSQWLNTVLLRSEISAISAGQEADNEAQAGAPQPSSSQEKITEINVEDSASNLQPERAENPINAAISTPQQEANLASEVGILLILTLADICVPLRRQDNAI